jgi:uncharacterized protein DUF6338
LEEPVPPDSLQAALVTSLLVLPGALYTWGIERVIGHWGVGLADRLLRFIGISACFHVALAPLTYHSYRAYFQAGALRAGSLSIGSWLALLAYVFGPLVVGLVVGRGLRRQSRWARAIAGAHRAPRAWDMVFGLRTPAYVWLRLKGSDDGDQARWLVGWYGTGRARGRIGSYGGRFPAQQDLYLAETFACNEETGQLLVRDGFLIPLNEGLLIRWDEIRYLHLTSLEG